MIRNIETLSKEELIIAATINDIEKRDPLYEARIVKHLQDTRDTLKKAIQDLETPPEIIDELDMKIKYYTQILGVSVKIHTIKSTTEDAFSEANITAHKQEAEKLGK